MNDFLDDMLGKDRAEAPPEASYKICVGERFANPIEAELTERAAMEVRALGVELPMIFIGDDGELEPPADGKPDPWCEFFDGSIPKPWEAAELTKEISALIAAHPRVIVARRRIELARSLGQRCNIQVIRGRATSPEYERLCKMEGIEP